MARAEVLNAYKAFAISDSEVVRRRHDDVERCGCGGPQKVRRGQARDFRCGDSKARPPISSTK
ncbi:hypothetical protein C1H46_014004 [Malus baccata]|uniref:Uncharacterized protein n=1 Tax=Malus baccata TaxID=106549 RepID=A0A540MNJ1_MALBA|nr:hypothetical protein C1H46_014004 [Malus baccata]